MFEEEELEMKISSPTDTDGIIGVLARSVCDHVGRGRFVTRKRKKKTLVANVKQ